MPPEGPDSDAAARVLGDFRLLRELGRGGMGVVYLAEQMPLRRTVALKVLPVDLTSSTARIDRFKREAEAAARLHHSNIVPIFAAGEDEGQHWIAMEFIEGVSLDRLFGALRSAKGVASSDSDVDLVLTSVKEGSSEAEPWRPGAPAEPRREARPSVDTTAIRTRAHVFRMAELFEKVSRALHYAHEHGIIHRDVKPGNILLDRDGEPHMTDFGLAHEEGTVSITRTGDLLGTPLYMSPEQLTAKRVPIDRRTDVYSLGVSLYQALTLRPPFEGDSSQDVIRQILFAEPAPPRRWNPRIARDLETVVLKSIEKNPDRRYPTAGELADDLHRFLREEPILARRASLPYRLWKKARSARVSVAASVGVVVGLVLLLVLAATLFVSGNPGGGGTRAAARASHERAIEFLAAGDFRAAVESAREAVRLQPANLSFLETLGDAQKKAGELGAALEAYAQALRVESRAALRGRYATTLADAGRFEEAVAQWTAILEARPDDFEAFHRRGEVHEKRKDHAAAIADFQKEAEVRRTRAEEKLARLPASLETPVTLDDLALVQEALEIEPSNCRANLVLAHASLREGKAADALLRIEKAIEGDPRSADAHLARARALRARGQTREAIEAADRAVELLPGRAEALVLRSELRAAAGNPEGAFSDAEEAVRRDPRSAEARLRRGAARFDRGDLSGARADFEAASVDPGRAGQAALLALGVCGLAQGDAGAARLAFHGALARAPGDPAARTLAGVAAFEEGNLKNAVAHFSESIREHGDPAEARVRRAFAFLAMGRLAEAWDDLDAALDRNVGAFARTLDLAVHPGPEANGALLAIALSKREEAHSSKTASGAGEEARRLRDRRRSLDPNGTVGTEYLLGRRPSPEGSRRDLLLGYARALRSGPDARKIAEEALFEAGVEAIPVLEEISREEGGKGRVASHARERANQLEEAADCLLGEWLCEEGESLPSAVAGLGDRALPLLARVLRARPDTVVGARAREAIVRVGGEGAGTVLAEALAGGPPEARLHALVGLSTLALPSTAPAIEPCLQDPDAVLRAYAVHALASVGGREAAGPLRKVVRAETDAFVRETAVRELASIGDRMGLILLAYIEKRPAEQGLPILSGFPLAGAAPPREERPEESEVVRLGADLGLPPYLVRARRNPDPLARAGAAPALGDSWSGGEGRSAQEGDQPSLAKMATTFGFDFLGELLKADPRVRIAALEALARGGDPSACGKLAQVAAGEDPLSTALAAEALAGVCGDRSPADAPFDLASLPAGPRRLAAEALLLEAERRPSEKWEEALRLHRRAGELDPSWPLPLARAGLLRANHGESGPGHEEIARALERGPSDPATLASVARHRLRCKSSCGSAVPLFEALVAARPEDPVRRAGLAQALAREKNPAGAREQIERALPLAGNDPEALLALAKACSAAGDRDRALDCVRRAIDGGYPTLALLTDDLGPVEDDPRYLELLGRP